MAQLLHAPVLIGPISIGSITLTVHREFGISWTALRQLRERCRLPQRISAKAMSNDSQLNSGTTNTELAGRELGDYRLLRRLGRGGMAEVYLAEQKSLGRRVAFKVLKKELAADENFIRRFQNEAQAAAALVHANIVQIYEVGCVDGVHFIAQEYVPGQTLKQLLNRGALEVPTAVQIMRQVALALHKAAGQGIVHRDIKPENILLGGENMVKVADFGLARFDDQRRSLELTEVGVTLGTPLYMSPEQVEGRKLDHRSDVYSFGVTAYHMLAGRPPFEGDTPLNLAVQHIKTEPPPLAELRTDLSAELCRIVHKLMAKNPDDRYGSMGDMLNDLRAVPVPGAIEDWSTGMELWAVPSEPTVPATRFAETQRLSVAMQTAGSARGGKRWVPWLASCLALAIGAALAWATRPIDPLAISAGEMVPRVAKWETAAAQYQYAVAVNEDDALRAVFEYFPPDRLEPGEDRYYALRAKAELARRYIENHEFQRALKLLEDLSNVDETEAEFQAFGFAGQAIIQSENGPHDEAVRNLMAAEKLKMHLDENLRRHLDRAARRIRSR